MVSSSATTQTSLGADSGFHHQETAENKCDCPIHQSRYRPFVAPKGLSFASDIEARSIPRDVAKEIIQAHHSYMSGEDLHPSCIEYHGIYYRNNLVGTIVYRAPLGRRRLDWDADGNLTPRPTNELKLDELPSPLSQRAQYFINPPSSERIEKSEVLGGTKIIELSRICLGVGMSNLASCALAASRDEFEKSSSCPDDVEYFMTMVRSDFDSTMIRALADRGWILRSLSTPCTSSGNRELKSINKAYKWVWITPTLEKEAEQQQAVSAVM